MDVPGIVRERLADERRMTSVNVGGDDRVYVTPPKTLVYHASGLFSSEEIEEYSHDARRFDVSADRREASFAFEYDDGVRGFSIPRERIETVLPPVLAGVLRANGLIDSDESVEESYRFGERTLVVTEARLLTSVGEAVWDRDYESYPYENVTDLRFEGDLVIEIDGQPRRIELSGDGRREAYETVEAALLAHHGVGSVDELPQRSQERSPEQANTGGERTASEWSAPTDDAREASGRTAAIDDTEADTDQSTPPPPSDGQPAEPPIREAPESDESDTETPTETTADSTETTDPERGDETDGAADLTENLDALRESVERQTELLERQQATLERLVEELDMQQVTDDQ